MTTAFDLRRLDWRFLLPDSGQRAYEHLVLLGGGTMAPSAATRLVELGVARRVERTLPRRREADALALLHDANVPLALALTCLRAGGVLYVEVARQARRRLRWTPRHVERLLARAGLTGAGLYWVKPHFERYEMYLPLDVDGALRWYFNSLYTANSPQRWLLEHALRASTGLRPRRYAPLAPHFAMVAVFGPRATTAAPATPAKSSPAVFTAGELAGPFGEEMVRPVMLTQAGERVVLLPFTRRGTEPVAVVKAPKLAALNEKNEAEQRVLGAVRAAAGERLAAHMPAPLSIARWGDRRIAVESYVPGQTLLASSGRWTSDPARKLADLRLAARWLGEFHAQTMQSRDRWTEEDVERWLAVPACTYAQTFGFHGREAALLDAAERRARELIGTPLPHVWQHRDFSVWNIYRAGSEVYVIDWEGGRVGLPLCDLLHFVVHWSDTAQALRSHAAQLDDFARLFCNEPASPAAARIYGGVERALREYLARLSIDPAFLPALVVSTWLQLALDHHRRRQGLAATMASDDHTTGGPDGALHGEPLAERQTEARADTPLTDYLCALATQTERLFDTWPRLPAGADRGNQAAREKVLVLAPFAPRADAPHGGGRAMARLLAGLAGRYRVALLYLRAPDEPPVDPALAAQCEITEQVVRPGGAGTLLAHWRRRARLAAGLIRGRPTWVTDFAVPEFGQALRRLAAEWQPDLIQVEYHVMAQYLPLLRSSRAAPAVPRVLTEHEPGASAAKERARLARQRRHYVAWVEAWLETHAWTSFERRALREVDAVVAFTERDRWAVAALAPQVRIERISLTVDLPAQPLNPLGVDPPRVVLVGNFAHTPNADAAARLVKGIFPRVRAQHPDSTLYIVGAEPPVELARNAPPGVVVTGYVPDTTPYVDEAAVVAVPLRLGGGMRVKVLEALAAGKAIVASARAVEGLAVTDGEHVILAESDEAFAAAILRLLAQPNERRALAERARAWACAHLVGDDPIVAYDVLYHSLLGACTNTIRPPTRPL